MISKQQEDKWESTQKKRKQKKGTKSKEQSPLVKSQLFSYKTLLCEITRLKGQQKLLYIKQAKLKNIDNTEFFNHYPYCQFDDFKFQIQGLKESGTIIQNQKGLHWTQSPKQSADSQASKQSYLLNGWSISILEDGCIFQGIYHDGKYCGEGYELHLNGNTYLGNFKEGSKSGKGTFYWFSSAQVYQGQWLGGLPHGFGKYLSEDYYEGNFCNGLKYGDGEQVFQNGDKYIGEYINGVADGYGEYFWKDKSVYKGDFKHGVRHGYGIWTDKNNVEMYSGSYRMDKKEGFGIYEWTGKQIFKGHFKEDYRDGFGKLYRILKKSSPEYDSLELREELVYQGMWSKGKQRKDLPVDTEAALKLDQFLSSSKPSPKKKQRIGHKNCIPKNN